MTGLMGEILVSLGYWGTAIVAIGAFIGVWLLTAGREWRQRQLKFIMSAAEMHGPAALPLIGNALQFACPHDESLHRLVKLFQPYDYPFRVWMGPKLFVGLRSPRDIEVVMNSPIATHKPYEYRFLETYLGRGIVTDSDIHFFDMEYQFWARNIHISSTHRAHRKLIMPMVNGKVLSTYFDAFDKHSRRCVECLESRVDTGEFDIMHFMDNCTLDIILETIMGTPGTAQHNGYKGLIDCSTRAITLAHARTLKVWLYPDWIYARTNAGKQFAEAMSILHEFAGNLVAQKKTEYHASESSSNSTKESITAVLDRLIACNEETNLMNDKGLRDGITNIWVPAQDPTALTSSFLFLMLGMHPEIQNKVRSEVRDVIGDGAITVEHISRLKYLEMVFKETVRLFPVGPVILRELQDDLDFETCTAPKGCTLALFVYMTHRDPKHWTEPEKFNPDRFKPENSVGRHPYAFIPFSSGIRGCIGRQYATIVIKTLVARVVQKYIITSSGSLDTLRLKVGVSIRSIDGYKISISRA